MNKFNYSALQPVRRLLFTNALVSLLSLLFVDSLVAQPRSDISAFITCIKDDGTAGLCTAQAWTLAEGYSATDQDSLAELSSRAFTVQTGQEACAAATVPASIELSLANENPGIGDRIRFEDFTIRAFDENNNLLPRVPVFIRVLAQDGILLTQSGWSHMEVMSQGFATIFVSFYCEQLAEVSDSATFTIDPA